MSDIDDFDAAKTIATALKDMDKGRQQKVLRLVVGYLEIGLGPAASAIPAGGATVLPSPAAGGQGGGSDIRTFIADKNPRTDIHFATAVAYYYRFVAPADAKKDAVSASDLTEASRLVQRPHKSPPKNALNNAKKAGYLDNAERGSFRINTVGENLVAMTLPGTGKVANVRRRKAAKKASKKAAKRR